MKNNRIANYELIFTSDFYVLMFFVRLFKLFKWIFFAEIRSVIQAAIHLLNISISEAQ